MGVHVTPFAQGLIASFLFVVATVGVSAQDIVGSISYLEGTVGIVRDATDLDGVAIGQDLQSFDLVKTGSDGQAELAISAPQIATMTVRMGPDTQFSLEMAIVDGKQESTIGIVGGQIALKVGKLLPTQSVKVKSDAAVMGVRGTSFTVTAPETGDILVTCDEGEVDVTDSQGENLTAIPGTGVEDRPGEVYRSLPISLSSADQFRAQWRSERGQFVETNALKLIRLNARHYRLLSREFNELHRELKKNEAITRKWASEDQDESDRPRRYFRNDK